MCYPQIGKGAREAAAGHRGRQTAGPGAGPLQGPVLHGGDVRRHPGVHIVSSARCCVSCVNVGDWYRKTSKCR